MTGQGGKLRPMIVPADAVRQRQRVLRQGTGYKGRVDGQEVTKWKAIVINGEDK